MLSLQKAAHDCLYVLFAMCNCRVSTAIASMLLSLVFATKRSLYCLGRSHRARVARSVPQLHLAIAMLSL